MARNRNSSCAGCGRRLNGRRGPDKYCPACTRDLKEDDRIWDELTKQGKGGEGLLEDLNAPKQDLKLVEQAVVQRWPVNLLRRPQIIDRLCDIVGKETVAVMTKEGPVELEGPADANAIAAARVMVAMEAQNQADEVQQAKQGKPDQGPTVVVQNNNTIQTSINLAPQVTRELLNDADYLEFERQRASQADTDPGVVCPAREPRSLENGTPSGPPRPGANGHHNGSK